MLKNNKVNSLPNENIEKAIQCLSNLHLEEAMKFIHLSFLEDSDFSQIHNLLGAYYELTGELNLARKHYRAAIDLEPSSTPPSNNLQRVCEHKNICSLEYIDFGKVVI